MKKKPSILPRGHRTCTASLAVSNVAAALSFYEAAFGAEIRSRDDNDAPGFATIKIGNSMLFVTAGWGAHLASAPGCIAPVSHHMYVEDVDATLDTALSAGAQMVAEPHDTYWGERCATVTDPFGHIWSLATRLEHLSAETVAERRMAMLEQSGDVADEIADETEERLPA